MIKLFKKEETSNNTETSNGIYTLLAVVNDPTLNLKFDEISRKAKECNCGIITMASWALDGCPSSLSQVSRESFQQEHQH
ncbi:MAG: hypothetical protein J0L67_09890 [Cytophagales bacterium]|nr:hypothetical protein [Cytophagales bacterium]